MEPIFRCPVCRGRIALWAVRQQFTCHHCQWILASNYGHAFPCALAVAAAAELVLATGLWFMLDEPSQAFGAWLAASCMLGFWAGWLALKRLVVLKPIRRRPQ